MKREEKKAIVQQIKENFEKDPNSLIVFFDYSSVSNEDIFQLKRQLKTSGARWKVYSNCLIKHAFPSLLEKIRNSNASIFCSMANDEHLGLLRDLLSFNKKNSNIKERIRGGIINNDFIEGDQLKKWATLPEKKSLLSEFCGVLQFSFLVLIDLIKKIGF